MLLEVLEAVDISIVVKQFVMLVRAIEVELDEPKVRSWETR